MTTVVIGLDLSLTGTGVARIATSTATPAVAVQLVTSKARARRKGDPAPTIGERSLRLRRLAGPITELCAGANLVVVEGPSYASDSGAAHDRAGLWWLVVARLTGAGLNVVEVPPSVVKTYATGKGNASKDAVLAAVVLRYQHQLTVPGNNEADALVLAAMGARFTGTPLEQSLPQTHTRAMTSVRWQPTT